MSQNLNEIAAVSNSLTETNSPMSAIAAMKGFAEDKDIKSQENADLCFKVLQTFLK